MSAHRTSSAVPAVAAAVLTMALGFLLRAPCLGSWADGRQYNRLCYSDVTALYASDDRDRGLSEDRVPYLEGDNEYPVLTGALMWVAAVPADSYPSYFVWTSIALTGAAAATAAVLHRIVGRRALLFSLAPTLAVYGLMNWDLLAVALATGATLMFLRDRDGGSGALLGLGAAAKVYPALLVVPFALDRLRRGRGHSARTLALAAAAAWVAVNLPFAAFGFHRWSEFFRFNAARVADWDSVWYLLGDVLGFEWDVGYLNALTAVLFVAVAIWVWRAVERRRPGFPAWTFGFPLLVVFLLTNKVYSPQFGLWLLPWFALTFPDLRLFALFQAADVAVFVTRFLFFARLTGVGDGVPFGAFEIAVLARAAILAACVVVWVRRGREAPGPEPAVEASPALEAA